MDYRRIEMKIVVNPDIQRMSVVKLRQYKKELKYLLAEAETYNSCPRHAVDGLRVKLKQIDGRLRK